MPGLWLMLFLVTSQPAASVANSTPVDIMEVTATYIPPLSIDSAAERPWKVVLREPGDSYLLLGGERGDVPTPLTVPAERLAALRSAILAEKFFRLKPEYGEIPVDGPEQRMEIRLGKMVKKVTINSIEGNMSKKRSLEVDRAMRVWFAITDCFQVPRRAAA